MLSERWFQTKCSRIEKPPTRDQITPLEVCYNLIYLSVVNKTINFALKTTQNGVYNTHCWCLLCGSCSSVGGNNLIVSNAHMSGVHKSRYPKAWIN